MTLRSLLNGPSLPTAARLAALPRPLRHLSRALLVAGIAVLTVASLIGYGLTGLLLCFLLLAIRAVMIHRTAAFAPLAIRTAKLALLSVLTVSGLAYFGARSQEAAAAHSIAFRAAEAASLERIAEILERDGRAGRLEVDQAREHRRSANIASRDPLFYGAVVPLFGLGGQFVQNWPEISAMSRLARVQVATMVTSGDAMEAFAAGEIVANPVLLCLSTPEGEVLNISVLGDGELVELSRGPLAPRFISICETGLKHAAGEVEA